jgi:tetratricopeptide (TPR) repeat protein
MTLESDQEGQHGFAVRILPWLVAAGALVVYLLTLNHWVSLLNLPQAGRVAGWAWQPELLSPAYFVATYPLRWLPEQWIPLGLNLFSALCAVLTLALLARSVALLPHDRTHEERERTRNEHALLSMRHAWLPPLLAVLVCGLQLTFWEHATNGTVEMFDLLLFAWVIRALLEYRVDGRDKWLLGAALVYGVGMTNNFAMWGFLPLFLAAVIGLRGLSFFRARFLGRLVLFGLAGLSLYLLLPLLASQSELGSISFWDALKTNLGMQKNILWLYPKLPTRNLENISWVLLVVVCVLPLLLFSIRWPSYFGDTSRLGVQMATVIFHFMFGLYLLVCVWCLFDAPFSPRYHGFSLPFLTFYYLAALSVGYFAGYFLLVFSERPIRGRRSAPSLRAVNRIVPALVVLLAVVAPVGLTLKNLPNVRATNGPVLAQYAAALTEGLPSRTVVLSDDPQRLFIARAWLARTGRLKDMMLLDTRALSWPAYHRHLAEEYLDKWERTPEAPAGQVYGPAFLVHLLTKLSQSYGIWYLHPSFGYYFESFYSQPHGMIYHLERYGTNSLLPPPLSADLIAENESFWTRVREQNLPPVLAVTVPRPGNARPDFAERCLQAVRVPPERNAQTLNLGAFYSRAVNEWGVELQKAGDLEKAGAYFELARKLNADNIVAQINEQYNRNLRAGRREPVQLPKSVEDTWIDKYRTWDQVLGQNGPYDEPGFCFAQGYTYLRAGLYRQAAQCFDRVRAFSPQDVISRMWLAQLNLMARLPDRTLEIVHELRDHPDQFVLNLTNRNELVALEARALFARQDADAAVRTLQAAVEHSPTNKHLLMTVTSAYFENGRYSNALAMIERYLALAPDDPSALLNQAAVHLQENAYPQAIATLNRLLTLVPTNSAARFYRAISWLRTGELDAAQKDYERLQTEFPNSYQVCYGLGEIAYRRKDTNAAIRWYEAYLTNAPSNTQESADIAQRLKELKGGSR